MKTDKELMKHGIPLRVDGLVDGARIAVEQGLSFDEYADMISKVIISGQPKWVVWMYLQKLEIHTIFLFCLECRSALEMVNDRHGYCLLCDFDNLPEIDNWGSQRRTLLA